MVCFQVAPILLCLSILAVATTESTSSQTPSNLLIGRSRSVIGGATATREHEGILNKIDADDEVIYVRKRDGRGEPLDGDKVSTKTNKSDYEEIYQSSLAHHLIIFLSLSI
jgi:hypothetical protein